MKFAVFPIKHADTTVTMTLDHLTTALSTVRPQMEQARAIAGVFNPATDHNARIHDFNLFKSPLDYITDLS